MHSKSGRAHKRGDSPPSEQACPQVCAPTEEFLRVGEVPSLGNRYSHWTRNGLVDRIPVAQAVVGVHLPARGTLPGQPGDLLWKDLRVSNSDGRHAKDPGIELLLNGGRSCGEPALQGPKDESIEREPPRGNRGARCGEVRLDRDDQRRQNRDNAKADSTYVCPELGLGVKATDGEKKAELCVLVLSVADVIGRRRCVRHALARSLIHRFAFSESLPEYCCSMYSRNGSIPAS